MGTGFNSKRRIAVTAEATNIVRRIGEDGCLHLPNQLRRDMAWTEYDPLEMFTNRLSQQVVIQKYQGVNKVLPYAKDMLQALGQSENRKVLLSQFDRIVWIGGMKIAEAERYCDRYISPNVLDQTIGNRVFVYENEDSLQISSVDGYDDIVLAAACIEEKSKVHGQLVMLADGKDDFATDAQEAALRLAVQFITAMIQRDQI